MFDLTNPYKSSIVKYAQELLGTKFPKYQAVLIRAAANMVTNEDATNFSRMMVDLYEAGFMKAVNDYKKQVEAHGLRVSVRAEKN